MTRKKRHMHLAKLIPDTSHAASSFLMVPSLISDLVHNLITTFPSSLASSSTWVTFLVFFSLQSHCICMSTQFFSTTPALHVAHSFPPSTWSSWYSCLAQQDTCGVLKFSAGLLVLHKGGTLGTEGFNQTWDCIPCLRFFHIRSCLPWYLHLFLQHQ